MALSFAFDFDAFFASFLSTTEEVTTLGTDYMNFQCLLGVGETGAFLWENIAYLLGPLILFLMLLPISYVVDKYEHKEVRKAEKERTKSVAERRDSFHKHRLKKKSKSKIVEKGVDESKDNWICSECGHHNQFSMTCELCDLKTRFNFKSQAFDEEIMTKVATKDTAVTLAKSNMLQTSMSIGIVLAFLIHPTLTQRTAMLFSCVQMGKDEYYLVENINTLCWGPEHIGIILGFALPMFMLYVAGIPVAGAIVLWNNAETILTAYTDFQTTKEQFSEGQRKRRATVTEKKGFTETIQYFDGVLQFHSNFGFLYVGYDYNHYWWEGVVTARKVIMSLLGTVFARDYYAQGLLGLMTLFSAALVHCQCHPFEEYSMDTFETISLLSSALIFFLGALTYGPEALENESYRTVCTSLALSVMVVYICVVIGMGVYVVREESYPVKKKMNDLLGWKTEAPSQDPRETGAAGNSAKTALKGIKPSSSSAAIELTELSSNKQGKSSGKSSTKRKTHSGRSPPAQQINPSNADMALPMDALDAVQAQAATKDQGASDTQNTSNMARSSPSNKARSFQKMDNPGYSHIAQDIAQDDPDSNETNVDGASGQAQHDHAPRSRSPSRSAAQTPSSSLVLSRSSLTQTTTPNK